MDPNALLSYMSFPGIFIRSKVEVVNGQEVREPNLDPNEYVVQKVRHSLLKLHSRKRGKLLLKGICHQLTTVWRKPIYLEPATGFGGQEGSGWDEKTFVLRWYPH